MPDRTYTTKYVVDASQALSALDQLVARLTAVDGLLTSIGPKLKDFARGADTPINKAATACGGLGKELGVVAQQAQQAQQNLNGVAGAAAAIPAPTNNAGGSVQGLSSSLMNMSSAMFVLRQIREAVEAIGRAAEDAKKYADEGAEKGLKDRDRAREYANLVGATGPTDEVMNQLWGIAQAGKMSLPDAIKYGEQFRGSSPAGLQKGNVGGGKRAGESQEDYEKRVEPITRGIEAEGAKFATRVGLDPATGGDLAGMLAQYGKVPDVATAAGQLNGLAYGLNEGRGKISVLARGALGAAASLINPEAGGSEGRVRDLTEMGAIAGVASVGAKTASSAGTKVLQSDRLLRKFAASDNPEVKALGITDRDSYVEALRKAAPVLSGPDAPRWLREHDFKAQTENDAGIAMAKNLGVLDQRIAKGGKIAADGPGAMAQNEAFGKTIAGQNREAEQIKEKGEFDQTKAHQYLTVARKAAEGQMHEERDLDTWGSNAYDLLQNVIGAPSRTLTGEWSRQERIDTRAAQNLIKSGRAAGIDMEKRYPGLAGGQPHGKTLDQVFAEIAPELEAKGFGFIGRENGVAAQKRGAAPNAGGNPAAAGGGAANPGAAAAPGPQAMGADDKGSDKIVAAIHSQTTELARLLDAGPGFGPGPFPPAAGPRRA